MQEPYFEMVWWVYLGTSALLTTFVWWRVRKLRPCWFKMLFLAWGTALLFTPSFNAAGDYWVPAMMAAGFDGLLTGTLAAAEPHLKSMGSVWAGLCLLGFLLCLVTRKKIKK